MSLCLTNKSGDIGGKGKCYQGIGNIYLENTDVKNAKKCYREFLKIAEDTGDEWSVATACYKLADISYIEGKKQNLREALEYCERSFAIRKLRSNREYANCAYIKAKILYRLGETKDARNLHSEVYELRKNLPNQSDRADSLFDIGLIEIDEKNPKAGLLKIKEAADISLQGK